MIDAIAKESLVIGIELGDVHYFEHIYYVDDNPL